MPRERKEFPTRQVLARQLRILQASQSTGPQLAAADVPTVLHSMVIGIDVQPRPLTVEEIAEFGDVFSAQILLQGKQPMTLEELASDIEALPGEVARPRRKMFVVAEGAAFQRIHPDILVNTRLLFTWQKESDTSAPDLLLSTALPPDDPAALMQLISWSETQGAFHFFERVDGQWMWAGNSFHALEDASRGKGPFDSHINGSLVMKELKFPWVHWHSQAAGIARDIIFPTPDLNSHKLLLTVSGAEQLETIVMSGVRRWTKRRVQRDMQSEGLANLPWYARQLLWTTSVNLVSSGTLFSELGNVEQFELPDTFFLDQDGIGEAFRELTGGTALPKRRISVQGPLYKQAIDQLRVHIEDSANAGTRIAGDTNFAFTVPERAFEDNAVLKELLVRQVFSARLMLCLLMIDFPNPVFSPIRASLLRYFPKTIPLGSKGAALDDQFLSALRETQETPDSSEARFLALWSDPDLAGTVQRRLASYLDAVQGRLATLQGVVDLLTLADSRREAFRKRVLNEFRHTTARNGALVARLQMTEDALIETKQSDVGEKEL